MACIAFSSIFFCILAAEFGNRRGRIFRTAVNTTDAKIEYRIKLLIKPPSI
jgi:hypothetical protein